MPDFERMLDKLAEDIASSPEDAAYARGVAAGKSKARKQVVIVVLILAAAAVLVALYT